MDWLVVLAEALPEETGGLDVLAVVEMTVVGTMVDSTKVFVVSLEVEELGEPKTKSPE